MLSILIPSKNNPTELYNKIYYYNNLNFSGEILIGDSSNEFNKKKFMDLLKKLKLKIKIEYIYLPNLSEAKTTKKLIEKSNFDYLIWSGDDDYLIPSTLYQCVKYLDKNTSFNSIHGSGLLFIINSQFKISHISNYNQPAFYGSKAENRIKEFLKTSGDTHYSVFRKKIMEKMYKSVDDFKSHLLEAGFLPILSSVLLGKMAKIDQLSIIRTKHPKDPKLKYKNEILDGIHKEEWLKDYNNLRRILTDILVNNENYSQVEAEKLVINLLKGYVKPFLLKLNKSVNTNLNYNNKFIFKFIRYFKISLIKYLNTSNNRKFNKIYNKEINLIYNITESMIKNN